MVTVEYPVVILSVLAIALLSYTVGKLVSLQRQATELSRVSILMATAAMVDAKGLKSAPVLRQVIERYVPIEKGEVSAEKLQEKQKELQTMFGSMFGGQSDPDNLV